MNVWKRLVLARRRLNIITKFVLAFVALLLLIGIVALTGFVSLNAVQSETKAAIDIGIEVQRQVFKMDAALRSARQLERDFFLKWSTMGFFEARQQYVEAHERKIDEVRDIYLSLQELLASGNVSPALQQSNPNLVAYRERVEEYSKKFNEAVRLVSDLGIDDVGKIAKLEQKSASLRDRFQLVGASELMVLYLEMRSFEKEYLSTRQESAMNEMYKAAQKLRDAVNTNSKLVTPERTQTLRYLDDYLSIAKEIAKLNEEISSKISKNIDVDSADVSNKLLELANAEVERARTAIDWKIRAARGLLFSTLVLAWIGAGAVARQFTSALRTLSEEQAKSERLLLNILPAPIASRLKREERTIADNFTEVTVLFADIVGFTELTARTPPIEMIEILNVIFSEFDQLADIHGLEKIKTIGDAYMVVGGLPVAKPNHAEAIADMALDMQATIAQYCMETGKAFTIRIGINTGPVIAGIIGTKKFTYDLWGDTVNIASRMESHGIPGRIQVTEATYKRLRQQYLFEERGSVPIKGKGQMNCYLLKGKKN